MPRRRADGSLPRQPRGGRGLLDGPAGGPEHEAYLDAAELCLRAAIEGHKAAREGACVDVYQAYVAEGVRSDLGGRLDETEARRGYAKARIALQRQRSQTFIDGMRANPGPDVPQTID